MTLWDLHVTATIRAYQHTHLTALEAFLATWRIP